MHDRAENDRSNQHFDQLNETVTAVSSVLPAADRSNPARHRKRSRSAPGHRDAYRTACVVQPPSSLCSPACRPPYGSDTIALFQSAEPVTTATRIALLPILL